VATRLRDGGHTVYAPTLDGCAERKHQVRTGITTEHQAAEIAEVLFYDDLRDVVRSGRAPAAWYCAALPKRRATGSPDWSLSTRWRSLTESEYTT
jgi:hypothetical protein